MAYGHEIAPISSPSILAGMRSAATRLIAAQGGLGKRDVVEADPAQVLRHPDADVPVAEFREVIGREIPWSVASASMKRGRPQRAAPAIG